MAVGFEDCLDFGEHALTQLLEFWAAVIDRRPVHRAQDAIGHRRRTRDLQEMMTSMNHDVFNTLASLRR